MKQASQSPVSAQVQQFLCRGVPELQQDVEHQVVTPSHVTCPCSDGQLRSNAEQLVPLTLLWQLPVPDSQVAVAVQRAFVWLVDIDIAAGGGALCAMAPQPASMGWARIAARTWLVRGVGAAVSAKPWTGAQKRAKARIQVVRIASPPLRQRFYTSLPRDAGEEKARREFRGPELWSRSLHGQRDLVGERLQQVELLGGDEPLRVGRVDSQDSHDALCGAQGEVEPLGGGEGVGGLAGDAAVVEDPLGDGLLALV